MSDTVLTIAKRIKDFLFFSINFLYTLTVNYSFVRIADCPYSRKVYIGCELNVLVALCSSFEFCSGTYFNKFLCHCHNVGKQQQHKHN